MNSIILLSTKNSRSVLLILLILFSIGAYFARTLPIDAVPDITNTQVMVNTKTLSLSPEQIERQVTFPIESELNGIPGVSEIRSLSKFGLSQVVVVFENNVDIYWARTQIFERLTAVPLPSGLRAELAPITSGLGEIVMYTLGFSTESSYFNRPLTERMIRLREIQEKIIRPELRKVHGVAEVDTNGGLRKEVHVNIDPLKLAEYGISVLEVRQILDQLGETIGGGYVQNTGQQLIVGLVQDTHKITNLPEFPVKRRLNGNLVRLKDIAEVRIESSQRVGAATAGGTETVLGTVLMRSGENSRQVAHSSVSELNKLDLPDGAKITLHYSRSYLVDTTISTVSKNLLEGAALVILILLLFLGDLKAALIVAAVIPLSMVGAFIGMKLTGVSANLMSLGALDFGLIVDGAVVLVENYIQKIGSSRGKKVDRSQFIASASLEIIKPVVFGVSIILVVYIPILFLTGTEGKMFRPMAISVLLALFTSLILTITFVPAIAKLVLNLDAHHAKFKLLVMVENFYSSLLKQLLNRTKFVFGSLALLFAGTILLFVTSIGSDFVPQLDEQDLVIGLVRNPSQGINQSIDDQIQAEKAIMKFPEVESVFSRLGTPDSGTDPMSINFADTFVILKKDRSTWSMDTTTQKRRTKTELFEAIKSELKTLNPDQEISETQPIEMRFNEILEGSRADVTLRIYGPDLEVLSKKINEAKDALADLRGLKDIQFDSLTALTRSKTLNLVPNFDEMARYSVLLPDLNDTFSVALAGLKIGSFYERDRSVPIILHLDEKFKDDPKKILELPVVSSNSGLVQLGQIASFTNQSQVTTIARSWGQRYSALSLFVENRDIQSFVTDAQKLIQEKLDIPPDYRLYWGGQFRNLQEAKSRFRVLIPLTLFAIVFLLWRNFNSLPLAVITLTVIPLSTIGGIWALWLRDMTLSVPAIIGFIALSGVAVMNGVVLITSIATVDNESSGFRTKLINGATRRLRPVLMTALVAILGFIPMAFSHGVGSEVQRPLATVVIGGLLVVTFLTLVALPVVAFAFRKSFHIFDES